jgi:hypothetical protein
VDESDLFAGSREDISLSKAPPAANVLNDGDVAALFGLELADTAPFQAPQIPKQAGKAKTAAKVAKATKKIKGKSGTTSLRALPRKTGTQVKAAARNPSSRARNGDHSPS